VKREELALLHVAGRPTAEVYDYKLLAQLPTNKTVFTETFCGVLDAKLPSPATKIPNR
jgi:hypothetical protein